MKIGVVIPNFAWTPRDALDVAAQAADVGIDGVFSYDHLWPMGNPSRPALAPFPLLGVIARRHERLHVGPLVARIGLVGPGILASQFRALAAIAPGRVIAPIGTGDSLSAEENRAYGIDFAPASERRDELFSVANELRHEGLSVWVGGGAQATVALAEEAQCAVNLWGATPDKVASQAQHTEVTWAGPVPSDDVAGHEQLAKVLDEVEAAGATWAVLGWPAPLAWLGERSQSGLA